jgi:hypothetical protein
MHQDSRRYKGRLVPSPEKECNQRVNHPLSKVFGKSEETQNHIYREQPKYNFKKLDNLKHAAELPYVMCEALCERGGKDVGPEVFSFAKTDSFFFEDINGEKMQNKNKTKTMRK